MDQPKPKRKKNRQPVEHDTTIPKHDTGFQTHPRKPRKESDGPAY